MIARRYAHCQIAITAERLGDPTRAREHYAACVAQAATTWAQYEWAAAKLRE